MLSGEELGLMISMYAAVVCKTGLNSDDLGRFERLMQKQAIARNKPEEMANMRRVIEQGRAKRGKT